MISCLYANISEIIKEMNNIIQYLDMGFAR